MPYINTIVFPYLALPDFFKESESFIIRAQSASDLVNDNTPVIAHFRQMYPQHANDFLLLSITSQGGDQEGKPNRPSRGDINNFKDKLCVYLTEHDPSLEVIAVHQDKKGEKSGHQFTPQFAPIRGPIGQIRGISWPGYNARMDVFMVRHQAEQVLPPKPIEFQDITESYSSSTHSQHINAGWIYILTNPAWPGWIKIGKTIDLSARLIGYNTGAPNIQNRYRYAYWTPNHHPLEQAYQIEQSIHKHLKSKSETQKSKQERCWSPNEASLEWYQMEIDEAKAIIEELISQLQT